MHTLPILPYDYEALEPVIDAETMRLHHTKHHQTYVDKLNTALENYPDLQSLSVDDLLTQIDTLPTDLQLIVKNHGGGHANHSLWWQIISPTGGDKNLRIDSPLEQALISSFGSLESFKKVFSEKALSVFGSGWAWLIKEGDQLIVMTTPNQESPLMQGKYPLLGLDVWEHAYYLKYQNRRPEYIEAFWQVVNWSEVSRRYDQTN